MSRRDAFRADWLNGNIRVLRDRYEKACRVPVRGPNEWWKAPGAHRAIRILIHREFDGADISILYFHGGGWIVGSPHTHADISTDLHRHTRLPVVAIDYGLAPEHSIDAAIEDGLAVVRHVLKGNSKQVMLCGDSAGASIAMAVERHAPMHLRKHIAGVCSLYGAFRPAGCNSIRAGTRESGMDQACLRRYWLLANGSRGQAPFSISVLARADGCPVYIMAGGSDPIRDDSIVLARALKSIGRNVTLDIVSFAGHGFLHRVHPDKARDGVWQRLSSWIDGLAAS